MKKTYIVFDLLKEESILFNSEENIVGILKKGRYDNLSVLSNDLHEKGIEIADLTIELLINPAFFQERCTVINLHQQTVCEYDEFIKMIKNM